MNKIKTFFLLPAREKFLFLEALSWLTLARLVLLLLPFRRILPLLKQKEFTVQGKTDPVSIRDATGRAAAATPWHSTCLMKSMAARWMLKRRRIPSGMAIGMAKDDKGKLMMHAWISAQGIDIVSKDQSYIELFIFE